MNKRQLELSIQSIQNIRSWKHDYNNHLITMTALAEEKKYSELLDYLKCLQESLPEHLSYISSGNITIDAIVTNKLMTAKQYQVDFQYSILLPAVCPLTDLELTAVLGNLLDNAIEACQKLRKRDESLKPSIQLSIKPFRDMLQIQLINSSDGKYKETKEDFLQTTKRDDILHGFGLRHVADIVKSANGIIKIQPENTHFTVSILIPLLMQKGEKIS